MHYFWNKFINLISRSAYLRSWRALNQVQQQYLKYIDYLHITYNNVAD